MARPIKDFVLAWDALSGSSTEEGWRAILLNPAGPCVLMAGRRFPDNQEALLAGFATISVPQAEKLPEGNGFEVSRADIKAEGKTWIALTRKESGSFELFTEMVGDVAGAMDVAADGGEEQILRAMLVRIRSWQEFMRKGIQALGTEAEIGLAGELSFLSALLSSGLPKNLAVESWVGSLDGIQDFMLGTGAVEVKATLASLGFPAKIGSLEQLDDCVRKPLFVSGIRFSQRETGQSLPDFVSSIKAELKGDTEAERVFQERLLAAGYFDTHADRYSRRFSLEKLRLVEVGDNFPRIIPGNVPDGIRKVMYEIDLDRVSSIDIGLAEVLKKLGVN